MLPGMTRSWAVLCNVGGRTSTPVCSSPDERFWITVQVTFKFLIAQVISNMLVTDPSLLLSVLDMPQLESSEQLNFMKLSESVAVHLKVALSYSFTVTLAGGSVILRRSGNNY